MLWASLVIDNIGTLATMDGSGPYGLGLVEDAALIIDGDRIVWCGPRAALPAAAQAREGRGLGVPTIDAGGRALVPGLIDCHTHLIFAGDRAADFARRARGETYAQVMASGGGIRSTMRKVRAASEDALLQETLPRARALLRRGVTTVEVKSGYGLDVESELRMLRVAHALKASQPIDVVPTLLAAHAVPPEHDGNAGAWIDVIVRDLLPEVARQQLAGTCDVFVEAGAFSVADARRMLVRAAELGLGVRVHAEQLSRSGGAALAAELGAWSAGHLEFVDDGDIAALAAAGVVCEVLSLAQVFLRGQRAIPGRKLVDAGCVTAVATDCNPGTAMSTDLPLAAGLAVTQCGLTAEEALLGITRNAARALRLDDRGVIAVGKRADLVLLDTPSPLDVIYRWSEPLARTVVCAGRVVHSQALP